MEKCFVIQPFDKGKFDKRYNDSYKQAIEAAGYTPYRVDNDMSVRVPIEDIEKSIKEASVCFADITIDNPNVWYELGFAFACDKDVVMICAEERTAFPFDIAHKFIIKYQTGSKSDYSELEQKITGKLLALAKTSKRATILNNAPVVATEGLRSNEIAILIFIAENEVNNTDGVPAYTVQSEMSKAGYRDIATSIGLRSLIKVKMLTTYITSEYNNSEYRVYKLTDEGEEWLLANQDKLEYRKDSDRAPEIASSSDDDELPF